MIQRFPTPDLLGDAVARHVIACAGESIQARGRFTVALSGGTTPKRSYERLATREFADLIDWERTHVLWSDERCVPPDDPQSNYRMAKEALLDRVPIPTEQIHRVRGEDQPERAAAQYERELRGLLQGSLSSPAERSEKSFSAQIDLVLLGLGEDGHTASLFPRQATVHENTRWVMATLAPDGKLWRITLTPVIINAARNVTFVVSGASKAGRLRQLIEGPFDPDTLPAQAIQPDQGRLTYMVDDAAFAAISDPGPQSSSRAKRGI
jgi:6-phosphogluconolactonase